MPPPARPRKPIPHFSRVEYLHPEKLEQIVQSGTNLFNSNVEDVNFGMYNSLSTFERPKANYRTGMVTPTKGKAGMNVFGAHGELPSERGRFLRAPGAPVKKLPFGNSRRRRAASRRVNKTRRN